MSPRPEETTLAPDPHVSAAALSVRLSRNMVIQGPGLVMAGLTGLTVLPWPAVAAWATAAITAVILEDHVLHLAASGRRFSEAARRWAPACRLLVTSTYALAAFALLSRGGAGAQMYAFALMFSSMTYVVLRYYARPGAMFASISPYLAILCLLCFSQSRAALAQGHWLSALAATFTMATLAFQGWSARGQLAATWSELLRARREAEEREQAADTANRAKSTFLAAMSHELRTPLNGVLGMAQALNSERLTKVQRERVKVIRRSGESLLAVLNDLLDLSKIEMSALELEVCEFDLEHLVRGIAAAYQPVANKKALTFSFEVSAEAAGRYLGDSARIRRVLYNLSENAVKFTDRGGVTLAVDREGDTVVFRIADTGAGIAADDQAHLFENFFQADASLSRRHGGVGLGLAICRELVGLMGGDIAVASELGRGSTFTVRVPLIPAVAAAERAPVEDEADDAPPVAIRILAAEDNATNQLVIKTLLAQVGVIPTLVENGREALAAWEAHDWDVILMDIQMPEMDGLAATRAIRSHELETGRRRTPIIAVTANAMAHQLVEYEAAGMEFVVPKPIDATRLYAVIEKALAEAPQPHAAAAA